MTKIKKEGRFEIINEVLEKYNGNRMKTAEHLNISTRTLRGHISKMKDENIEVCPPEINKSDREFMKSIFPSNKYRLKHLDDMINRSH